MPSSDSEVLGVVRGPGSFQRLTIAQNNTPGHIQIETWTGAVYNEASLAGSSLSLHKGRTLLMEAAGPASHVHLNRERAPLARFL